MAAKIIDGKALAEELRQSFKSRVEALAAKKTLVALQQLRTPSP